MTTPPPTDLNTPDPLNEILRSNRIWSRSVNTTDPNFLPALSKGQSPKILWIGCADSRVPETTVLGLKPGEVFVHRNIANILTSTDLSSLSVIEYAVVYLKVKHIVVCGHTNCGGVAAALGNKKLGKVDTWLMPLRALRLEHATELEGMDETAKARKLVELNVEAAIECLRRNPDILAATKERELSLHGVVYDLAKGEVVRVDCVDEHPGVAGEKQREDAYQLV